MGANDVTKFLDVFYSSAKILICARIMCGDSPYYLRAVIGNNPQALKHRALKTLLACIQDEFKDQIVPLPTDHLRATRIQRTLLFLSGMELIQSYLT